MNHLRTNTEIYKVEKVNIFNNKINTEKLFEYAIEQANLGKNKKALEIARECLISAKQNNLYLTIYIHSFMAAMNVDIMKYGNARIHIYNAMNRLNKEHFSYKTDKKYLEALLGQVNSKDKEFKQLEFEALAA